MTKSLKFYILFTFLGMVGLYILGGFLYYKYKSLSQAANGVSSSIGGIASAVSSIGSIFKL